MSEQEKQDARWTEAPASVSIKVNFNGFDTMLTLRGDTGGEVLTKLSTAIDWLAANGAQTSAPTKPAPTGNGNATASAHETVDENGWRRGVAECALIKLGTAYNSGKPQLQFECNGMEHPLRYTRDKSDMIELLKPIGVSGDELVDGFMRGGSFVVEWAQPPDKKYRNVVSVKPKA